MGDARKRMEATVEVVEENGLEIRPDMTELTERRQGKEGRKDMGSPHPRRSYESRTAEELGAQPD